MEVLVANGYNGWGRTVSALLCLTGWAASAALFWILEQTPLSFGVFRYGDAGQLTVPDTVTPNFWGLLLTIVLVVVHAGAWGYQLGDSEVEGEEWWKMSLWAIVPQVLILSLLENTNHGEWAVLLTALSHFVLIAWIPLRRDAEGPDDEWVLQDPRVQAQIAAVIAEEAAAAAKEAAEEAAAALVAAKQELSAKLAE